MENICRSSRRILLAYSKASKAIRQPSKLTARGAAWRFAKFARPGGTSDSVLDSLGVAVGPSGAACDDVADVAFEAADAADTEPELSVELTKLGDVVLAVAAADDSTPGLAVASSALVAAVLGTSSKELVPLRIS